MSRAIFGKDITRSFIADDGSQYISIPTQTPTIYIFDVVPSYAQSLAGTGAIATVSSWTQASATNELTYTIPAIDDPDPSGSLREREYWEVILYKLQDSEQTQRKIRMFCISRADVLESIPNLTAADIAAIWPAYTSYISATQLQAFIPTAELEMRSEIGLDEWPKVVHLSDAKLALAYKAIELMAASQVSKGNGDKFLWMIDYFGGKYSQAKSRLELPIDCDGDGRPESEVQTNSGVVFISR